MPLLSEDSVLNYFGKYEKLQSRDSFLFTEPTLPFLASFVENGNKERREDERDNFVYFASPGPKSHSVSDCVAGWPRAMFSPVK